MLYRLPRLLRKLGSRQPQMALCIGGLGLCSLSGLAPMALADPSLPATTSPPRLSQVSPQPRPMVQGDQIVLNGRTLPAAWLLWPGGTPTAGRIGISDAGLMRQIGVELLNSSSAAQQPVQWFSLPATAPLNLTAQLSGPLRYLDITDLSRQFGWQTQINGRSLQITTPMAKVLAVRQGKQAWGDRLVIELDRPAPWQVDPQAQEFVLTVEGQIDPALLQGLKFTAGNRVQSIKVESLGNRSRLRLGIPISLRPRVWSLPNPNRIIVDVRADSLTERDILWTAGIRWRSQLVALGSAQFPVVWLEVNPRQPGLLIQPILPNPASVAGISPLSQTAQVNQATAAINGGYFNRNNQLPLGAIRLNGRWLSGPILGRGAIAWNPSGEFSIRRLALQETLTTSSGQRFPLGYLNSAYPQAGISRYTPDWGPTYTPLTNEEIIVTVQGDRVVGQQTMGTAGTGSMTIPANGYILAARSAKTAATALPPGTVLQIAAATDPADFARFPNIVGAGPLLIQNRQIVLDAKLEKFSDAFIAETASRSAIATLPNGNLLIVAVHNRVDGKGASLSDMAQIMQQLGAQDALNLDGGSSTTLYLGGQLLDRLPRTAARVHNGIGILIPLSP